MVGRTIGPYRVLEQIGAGGMGVVYRAEDTRLGRQVALKFLTAGSLPDDHARRRFDREARATSALSHPNICTLYEIAYDDGTPFLVMELLDGETLKARLARGPVPLPELIELALPIADALEVAHAQGVVHRDLKPANIFITKRGVPKLLDFGLAKVLAPDASDAEAATREGPPELTGSHVVLGTLPYMSPEQVRGQALDARTDLFSFGAVLYEMATGVSPFGGDTSGIILENVLTRVPLTPGLLAAECPAALDALLAKALEKDRDLRYQSAREMVIDLKRLRGASTGAVPSTAASSSRKRRRTVPVAAAAVLIVAGVGLAGWLLGGGRDADRPVRLELGAIRQVTSLSGLETRPSLSPDGTMVAFVWQETDNTDIWVKQVAGGTALRITDDPADDTDPDWSPDGSLIAFRSGRRGGGIYVVPALGGDVSRLTTFGARPRWSPDGRRVLFQTRPGMLIPNDVYVVDFPGGEPRKLIDDADGSGRLLLPAWSPDGRHVALYFGPGAQRPGLSVASPGSAEPPFRLEWDGVRLPSSTGATWTADGRGLIVESATLSYVPLTRTLRPAGPMMRLTTGNDLLGDVSADGRSLAYVGARSAQTDIWKVRLDPRTGQPAGAPVRVIASSADDYHPLPLPDNRHLLLISTRDGAPYLYVSDLDGRSVRLVDRSRNWRVALDVSADGRSVLLHTRDNPNADFENFILPFDPVAVAAGGPAQRIAGTDFYPGGFSPDGRHLLVESFSKPLEHINVLENPFRSPVPVEWALNEEARQRYPVRSNYTFAADGRWVVFAAETTGGRNVVLAVRPGGGSPHVVVEDAVMPLRGSTADRLYLQSWAGDGTLTELGLVGFDPMAGRATTPYQRLRIEPGPGAQRMGPGGVTRDGRWYFFAWTREEGDVYVADIVVRR